MFYLVGLVENQEEDFMNIKSFHTITFEVTDRVGILKINRPDKLNALNSQVLTELSALLDDIQGLSYDQLIGLIITGEGEKSFIAGADIAEMSAMTIEQANSFGKLGQDVTLKIENLSIPVVSAVNGFALGGGCELAMAADFIVATRNALFGQPEVKLGLIPGFGGTQRLVKLIGRNRAKELIYTGRNIKSEEGLRLGLVLDLFDSKEAMLQHCSSLLKEISKNSLLAVSSAKNVINRGADLEVEKGLDLELKEFSKIFASEDMKEGTSAFIEKRKPNFKGC